MTVTGPLTNTASTAVLPDQPDPVPGNNTASATVTAQSADIAVTKTVDNATPYVNTTAVTFTITAHNNGPSDATGVEVTDVLPGILTRVSFSVTAGTYVPATGIWHIGPLANGVTQTLSIVATANTTTPAINTATRTAGNQPDPNSANDTSSATVTGQQADIATQRFRRPMAPARYYTRQNRPLNLTSGQRHRRTRAIGLIVCRRDCRTYLIYGRLLSRSVRVARSLTLARATATGHS